MNNVYMYHHHHVYLTHLGTKQSHSIQGDKEDRGLAASFLQQKFWNIPSEEWRRYFAGCTRLRGHVRAKPF
jgi:hypothetical protein